MQLQLLQTHQALGQGNPPSLLLLLHELVLCFICPIKGKAFSRVLLSPACVPLSLCSPGVTQMRRQGSAWALPPPALPSLVLLTPAVFAEGMSGWCRSRLHSGRSMHVHTHTRVGTHLPQGKHRTGGAARSSPPPTRSRGTPRDPLCSAVPQVCRSPKGSLLCSADVAPALGWCLGAPWMGSSLPRASTPSIQGSCPQLCSSLHPQTLGCGCSPA